MGQYREFAHIYDRLMEDVDYESWVEYLVQIIKNEGKNVKKILELGCGTGNITIPLAKKGYDLTAVDISPDMLTIAKYKAMKENRAIFFVEQDMKELQLERKYECIIAMCDAINYITDEKELIEVFKRVYRILDKNGVFIFDISTYYKLKYIIGNSIFGEDLGDICYLWQNFFDEDEQKIEMELTFFIQEGMLFRKIEEFHIQKAYYNQDIKSILHAVGFNNIKSYDAFSFNSPQEDSERVFFIGKK